MIWLLLACTSAPVDTAPPTCAELERTHGDLETVDDIQVALTAVQAALFPALDGVRVDLVSSESETDFFVANLDLSTLEDAPMSRAYRVLYSTHALPQDVPGDGVVAILAHELKHVLDYTAMDTETLVDFALWYAEGDIAAYERETDEAALERGCAAGLKAYRVWLYDQVDDETRAAKERDYYTPDEIDAWVAAH